MAGHKQETKQGLWERWEALKPENTPLPVPRALISTTSKAGGHL